MTAIEARRSAWIPWIFVGGMAVVIAVNAVLIVKAMTSFPGLVVDRPYDRGIAYNDELRQNREQAMLGWSVSPRYTPGRLSIRIVDAAGAAVPGLDIHATVSRPLGAEFRIDTRLKPSGEVYVGDIELLRPGQWEIRIEASGVAGAYRAAYRIVVP